MKLFALIAVAIYCAVSLIMAVRLLLLARRTREWPECLIGLAFLTGGMFGYPFSVASSVLDAASKPEAAFVCNVIGQSGMAVAAFFILLTWRKIFAPKIRGGSALIVAWAVLIATTTAAVIMTAPLDSVGRLQLEIEWALLAAQAGCYGLIAWASIRHARALERRCALGLADPLVANRIMLWGLAKLSITTSYTYSIVAGLLLRFEVANIFQPAAVAGFGLTAACCVTLAFLPPRAYVERIRARAEQRVV